LCSSYLVQKYSGPPVDADRFSQPIDRLLREIDLVDAAFEAPREASAYTGLP
jgi:hypothetical protein